MSNRRIHVDFGMEKEPTTEGSNGLGLCFLFLFSRSFLPHSSYALKWLYCNLDKTICLNTQAFNL